MRILLAPSEGKTTGTENQPLVWEKLLFPELTAARQAVLKALIAASGRKDALDILKVGQRVADDVYANLELETAPTGPAYKIYTGVAFDAARLWEFSALPGGNTVLRHVRIMSGLFGIVRATDRIPAYRLSMGTKLPQLGNNTTFWKRELRASMDQDTSDQLVIDCRSGAYQKPWTSSADSLVVSTRIMREKNGKLAVVSHHAKHWRGLITRACLCHSLQLPSDVQLSDGLNLPDDSPLAEDFKSSEGATVPTCVAAETGVSVPRDITEPQQLAEICAQIDGVIDVQLEPTRDGLEMTLIAQG